MSQISPVGPVPSADVCLVGALLYSAPSGAADVLALVHDGDVEQPTLAAVLAAVRRLADSGKPIGPQTTFDELRRVGQLRGGVPDALRDATTCGADSTSARHYAAAVVAGSLRRRVESAGVALTAIAADGAEADIAPLVAWATAACLETAERLRRLRGES